MSFSRPASISIVINSCNRATSLDKTIKSIFQQAADNVELIVVNGPSTDATEQVLQQYVSKIHICRCDEYNLSVSRNIGIATASGDVVAFIDDDAFPEPSWAERLLSGYSSEEVGAVGGWVFDHSGVDYQSNYIICDRYGSAWPKELVDPSELYSFPKAFKFSALIGTNCSFRRDILLSIGGFDEEYEYFLDETDVCARVIDAGYKIVQLEDAIVHHKFLPSHIRNARRATIHHYPILKNSLYFALKHVVPYKGVGAAMLHSENVYKAHLRDAKWFVDQGELAQDKLDGLPAIYEKSKSDALYRYEQRSARGITEELLRKQRANFLPTSLAFKPTTNRLCVAMLCRQYDALDSGIARFIRAQARALAHAGHIVHVLTLTREETSMVDWEEGVWVHRMKAAWYPDAPSGLSFPVHPSQWCYSMTMLDEVRNINRRHKVDVVEAPIWDNESLAFVHFNEYPVVVSLQTSIGIALETHPEWRENTTYMNEFVIPAIKAENYILSNCAAIRAISSAIAEEIGKRNDLDMGRLPVEVCRLALEDRAQTVIRYDRQNQDVFFLGRLELRKGIDTLLSAIPAVLERLPAARFLIAGDKTILMHGSNTTFDQQFLQQFPQLKDKVMFLGKISDDEVDLHLRNSAIFVAPSRFESFGLIYVEAMMFGTPSIGCNVGGIPEVLGESKAGYLIDPDDPVALAEKICMLLQDPGKRAEFGVNGRVAYEQRFSPSKISDSLVQLYRRAITRANSGQLTASKVRV